MINKKVTLIGSLLLGLVAFSGFVTSKTVAYEVSEPEDFNHGPPAGVSCYMTGKPITKKSPQVQELESAKSQLESLYKEKMINEETYKTRMEKINAQLKQLEEEATKILEIEVDRAQEKVREAGDDE